MPGERMAQIIISQLNNTAAVKTGNASA